MSAQHQNAVLGTLASSWILPGTQTFLSNGTFIVPPYNTLRVELWGAGGPGVGISGTSYFNGTRVANTTFASLAVGANIASPIAASGLAGSSTTGGSGGTYTNCTGGTNGTAGTNGASTTVSTTDSGAGGNSGGGAIGGAAQTTDSVDAADVTLNGNPGNEYGGGGGGALFIDGTFGKYGSSYVTRAGAGGGGGAYGYKDYIAGNMKPGETVIVIVGPTAAGGSASLTGGNGAAGKVVITWS